MTEVKLTDSRIKELVRNVGLDQRERGLVEGALEIYMRKYGALGEDRVKELLKCLERANLISSNDLDRVLKKVFEV